eukprot:TRINITY_DN6172_c0_g4_i2.p1 TRINITY_DN6172_c0_g4~~TRINITY_DN6172_c0_g4_i2.p1  ORF type:complete len:722 (-),score=143.49 TRINITY_DN6172_c0_g4_i2:60-2225(-)
MHVSRALRGLGLVFFTTVTGLATLSYHKITKTIAEAKQTKLSIPPPYGKVPTRNELLEKLKQNEVFDLLVVGGGATGTGIALDAATRGLSVALVERGDFSSGTSSRSTKLVHGGVRYLQKAILNLDIEQYKLVKEALHERSTFLKVAPHLTSSLPIMIPVEKWYMIPYYWFGSKVYDLVAGNQGLDSSYFLSKARAIESFPMLKSENLAGAVVYYDGQQNDARMNITLATTAALHGAVVANYVEVSELLKEEDQSTGRQIVKGARLTDRLTGNTWNVRARGVINATGPFTDSIRKMDDPDCKEIVVPSSGVHVVLPGYFSPRSMGLLDPATSDGRVIFFLPWQGNTIAGTTDSAIEVTDLPKPKEEEINWILNEIANYLHPDVKLRRGDVLAAWSGIRPLIKDLNAINTESLSRNHLIHLSDNKLLTIAGGKWTTYRRMAEDCVDKAIEAFQLNPQYPHCRTEHVPLLGAQRYSPTMFINLIQQFGLDKRIARHLAESYGDRAFAVATYAQPTGQRWPVLGKQLIQTYPYIEAEVIYAVKYEFAVTAIDVLARRTRLAFLNANAAWDCLPKVIEIMAKEIGWDAERIEKEFRYGKEFLMTMGMNDTSEPIRSDFNALEIVTFRDAFTQIDSNSDGHIDVHELRNIFQTLGQTINDEELKILFSQVDKNQNGTLEFNEFLDLMFIIKHSQNQAPYHTINTKFGNLIQDLEKPIAVHRSNWGL